MKMDNEDKIGLAATVTALIFTATLILSVVYVWTEDIFWAKWAFTTFICSIITFQIYLMFKA